MLEATKCYYQTVQSCNLLKRNLLGPSKAGRLKPEGLPLPHGHLVAINGDSVAVACGLGDRVRLKVKQERRGDLHLADLSHLRRRYLRDPSNNNRHRDMTLSSTKL
eukprot:9494589-Pyramimonas_sp.AAC.1